MVAGLNAALRVAGRDPLILERWTSYIGVMIDDLVLQGVTEPYRMLTARAEHRLRLRADNAETRLSAIAESIGALGTGRQADVAERQAQRATGRAALDRDLDTAGMRAADIALPADGVRRPLGHWATVADSATLARLVAADPNLATLPLPIIDELVEDARYAPYIARHDAELRALAANERVLLDPALDYAGIGGLSTEMIERLDAARPETLGQAGRIAGITPAALTAILVHSRRMAA